MPVHRLDEVGHLAGALRVHDPAEARPPALGILDHPSRVGDHAHGGPAEEARPADHLAGVIGLELIEVVAVEDRLEQLSCLVRLAMIRREDSVEIRRRPAWRLDRLRRCRLWRGRQLGHEPAELGHARLVVLHPVVRDAAHLGVDARTAQLLGADRLSRGTLHQVRPAEAHERGALHHEDHVGERREIRAPGDARSHDRRELRHPQIAAHDRVVVEQTGRAVLAREDAPLIGEVHARGIDQVDDRDTAAHRDLLSAEHLRDGLGPPRPGLDRRVVGHDHGFAPFHHAHARDHPGGRGLALVAVVRHQEPHLDPGRVVVQEERHALTGGELALLVLPLDALGSAAFLQPQAERHQLAAQLLQPARRGLAHARAPRSARLMPA